tara:strand:+ start:2903 stop:3091 length:189 start_codon:yes stop_codon:yes gene_type:complete
MIHLLALLIATNGFTCAEIAAKVEKVKSYPDLTPQEREELIELYTVYLPEAMEVECNWDAND